MQNNLDAIAVLFEGIMELDTQLIMATPAEQKQLMGARLLLINQIHGLAKDNTNLGNSVTYNRIQAANSLSLDNDLITATQGYEQNRKSLNTVYLSYIANSLQGFSQSELTTLESIAQQCPLEGGNAVFEARALLAIVDEVLTEYDDQTACYSLPALQVPASNSMDIMASPDELRVYPNPAREHLILSWQNANFEAGQFQVCDLHGKILLQRNVEPGNRIETLDISGLPRGIYIVTLHLDKQKPLVKKFAIN